MTFYFVQNPVLQQNISNCLSHIVDLATVATNKEHSFSELSLSSFRLSIIIHSATIIEALLFDYMELCFQDSDYEEYKWELDNSKIKVLYNIDEYIRIIGGEQHNNKHVLQKNKLNLNQINKMLKDKKHISRELFILIDKVRELRNQQHLGTSMKVRTYSKSDLNTVLNTLKQVKDFLEIKYADRLLSP